MAQFGLIRIHMAAAVTATNPTTNSEKAASIATRKGVSSTVTNSGGDLMSVTAGSNWFQP